MDSSATGGRAEAAATTADKRQRRELAWLGAAAAAVLGFFSAAVIAWAALGLSFAGVTVPALAGCRFLGHMAQKEGRWAHPGGILIAYALAAAGWAAAATGVIEFLHGRPEFASYSLWRTALAAGGVGAGCWALVFIPLASRPPFRTNSHASR